MEWGWRLRKRKPGANSAFQLIRGSMANDGLKDPPEIASCDAEMQDRNHT
jgi:hypothetical protein